MFIMLLKACQYEYLADTNQKAARKQSGPRCGKHRLSDGLTVGLSDSQAICLFVALAVRRLSVQIKERLRNRWDIRVYLAAPVASGGQVFSLNTNYPMGNCAPPAYRCRSTTSSRESQVPVQVPCSMLHAPQSMAKSPVTRVGCALRDASSIFVKLSFELTFTFDQHQVATGQWLLSLSAGCLPLADCPLIVATAGQTVVALLQVARCTFPVARSRLPSALPSSLT